MASVPIDQVLKQYGAASVIHGVSVDIEDGEFVTLVGPSGYGKSTLLRMLAGLEDISGGEIRIDGGIVNEVAPKERHIAMVFQSYALYPDMTVRENMGFALKLQGRDKATIEKLVGEAAGVLALEPLLDRLPKQLSGGQRQRVAMGRAIVRHPKVFLFDEPLSNLDAKLRVTMRSEPLPLPVLAGKLEACTYGIRPEDLELSKTGIPATVLTVEPTGAETHLSVRVGTQTVVIVLHRRMDLKPDQQIHLAPNPDKIHLFSAHGMRIN